LQPAVWRRPKWFATAREAALGQAVRALVECDMALLSGGASRDAGDLSHGIVSRLGKPGILVHGVPLKPCKPLCAEGKPIVVLPDFPTSAIFTFHAFVALVKEPFLRSCSWRKLCH
jgi:putative molybdopterin biosynthesis protein